MLRYRSLFFYLFLLLLILLFVACWEPSSSTPDTGISTHNEKEVSDELNAISSESTTSVYSSAGKTEDGSSNSVDWGRESTIDEMLEMARNGQIAEIQWHMMPNVIRAQALDGNITHIKNEDKGVDIVSVFKKAGVSLGKEGIPFQYLF